MNKTICITDQILKYKLTSDKAIVPHYGSRAAAGLDLFSAEHTMIAPKETLSISTDVILEISEGCYGRIADRSSMAYFNSIHCLAGVIDCDYRGIIKVVLHNLSDKPYFIDIGDKIAQLIITPYIHCKTVPVSFMTTTDRNDKGFGSTGK